MLNLTPRSCGTERYNLSPPLTPNYVAGCHGMVSVLSERCQPLILSQRHSAIVTIYVFLFQYDVSSTVRPLVEDDTLFLSTMDPGFASELAPK